MDWSGLNIPFSITDIINGSTKLFMSFAPLIWLFLGICLALFALQGLFFIFVKHESFFPWER
ncbi:hypothetical protein REC12_15480 [Desulfosporosinus sp. PR]|uniref:hypothetical protein n=1 Tax=Candidatus Desulfosporosinus nitrosoreducens TaxID=3401928 RepID=UPI0027FB2881|nr:hypothetical protein [Desulfosporosinus sp. PR]MDQ7094997.1 hypothetical protein [Desulfosporosinus sp. PR]